MTREAIDTLCYFSGVMGGAVAVQAMAHRTCALRCAAGRHSGRGGAAASPIPVALGGPFALEEPNGAGRTEAEPQGSLQILFFGYAACEAICTVARPRMAETAAFVAAAGL